MFENLTARLQETFRRLRGKGKLSERDVDEALREVRIALLEADVNFKVVRDFIARVRGRACGQEVMASLSPGQQVIKIVNAELTALMGGQESRLQYSSKPPTVIMLVGLQGSGKTTTAAKLAHLLKRHGKHPLLVAADTKRPAAIRQLQVLGERVGVDVVATHEGDDAVRVAKQGMERAAGLGRDVVIVDTAGRLHVDDELMDELAQMKAQLNPAEVLLVVDAMTGQDAVNVARVFNERLGLSGMILTKLDGDARGGAALSARAVTGQPVKFVGVGEKMDALEPFHPDRMASRILGMGDVLSLIERAEAAYDEEQARKLAEKIKSNEFTLEDFADQLRQMKKIGPLDEILSMLPGFGRIRGAAEVKVDEGQLKRVEAIVNSMTPEERRNPTIIDGSRRKRIARGSGTRIQDVNSVLRQFEQVRDMLRQFGGAEKAARRAMRKGAFPFVK
ncbi:MAG: signal recognition particle protein [Firmicutes bacterium]|nr:signal recognition particle protein [Bacillota bacterium]MDH7494913.1 signal recognition particle protein [Bacillota bacterium]